MQVNDKFKNDILAFGKQIAIKLTIGDLVLENKNILSCTKAFEGDLFKSIMQYVDIELKGAYQLQGKSISVSFGVKQYIDATYNYIDWGEFVIDTDSIKYNIEKDSTSFTAYDYLVKSHIKYDLEVSYPITVGDYLEAICSKLGLNLLTKSFVNSSKSIDSEKFDSLNTTYRDILDDLSAVVGGAILSKGKDLIVKYPSDTNYIIDENNLKSLNFNGLWGPINSLVLSRQPQNDDFFKNDTESIKVNGLKEIKLVNNQIMDKNRDIFIEELFTRLKGLEFYPFQIEAFGYCFFEPLDVVTVKNLEGKAHKCLILSDSIEVDGGVKETLGMKLPSSTTTDYTKATSISKELHKTQLQVDKVKGEILSLVEDVNTKISKIDGSSLRLLANASSLVLDKETDSVIIDAQLLDGNEDVTEKHGAALFEWLKNGVSYRRTKSIEVTKVDIDARATFVCNFKLGASTFKSNPIVITDNTDIAHLGNSYIDVLGASNVQNYDNGKFTPDWSKQNLKLVPVVLDDNDTISLSDCDITFKKLVDNQEVELSSDEVVDNGILTIKNNVLTLDNPTIRYICSISYKNAKIKLIQAITLVKNGSDGVIKSSDEPINKSQVWLDETSNTLKQFDGNDWVSVNDYTNDINNARVEVSKELSSTEQRLKDLISNIVSEITTVKTNTEEISNTLSSQLIQNSNSISLITSELTNINNVLNGTATKEEISKWARFQNGVLSLGASNSSFETKISNTELGFYENNKKIAYISNQQLHINQGIIAESLGVGNWKIVQMSNGNLNFI